LEHQAERVFCGLRAGFVIPGVLLSGVNSEVPGTIIALAQDVYDNATGTDLLIPQGARLIGSYSANVQYGQSRLFVVWQRIVFPDGRALDIGAEPGTDSAGYAGKCRDRIKGESGAEPGDILKTDLSIRLARAKKGSCARIITLRKKVSWKTQNERPLIKEGGSRFNLTVACRSYVHATCSWNPLRSIAPQSSKWPHKVLPVISMSSIKAIRFSRTHWSILHF
jgi:Bacterial conjugation TrbI-like protein